MTAISSAAPRPSNNPLITSVAEHLRLIAQEVSAASILIFDVAHLVAQYLHDRSLTDWHTALSRLGQLPAQIPPLHLGTNEIRDGICPIRGSYYLLPRGTLNGFAVLVSDYGQKHLAAAFGEVNPLQFRNFWDPARQDHGDIKFEKDEWRWMSDDILEGSCGQSYEEQAQMVAKLGAHFAIPFLRDAAECLLLRKIAKEASLLQEEDEQNGDLISAYTSVQETTQGCPLIIGDSTFSGLAVYRHYYHKDEDVGVLAFRKKF